VRQFCLDPEQRRAERFVFGFRQTGRDDRCFRITNSSAAPRQGERRVEVIRDAWGRDYAVVMASRCLSL
jgi:hypothetical protein